MKNIRQQIGQQFSAAALQYDQFAEFQRAETERLCEAAIAYVPPAARLADIGCGTGYFAQLAALTRPRWHVYGVDIAHGMCQIAARRCRAIQADAAVLPLADESCDAVVSSLCLQWVENLPRVFREMRRVLRPGGIGIVISLGGNTLYELRERAEAAQLPLRILPIRDADAYHTAIDQYRFEMLRFEQDMSIRHYPNVMALLDSMRRIGAGNNFAAPARGMLGAQSWKKMLASYERLRGERGLPATWERLFMVMRKTP